MASRSNVVSGVSCKKCSKDVKVYIVRGKCSSSYHPSCLLKISGTYVNSEGVIICCEDLNKKLCAYESQNEEINTLKKRLSNINESLYEISITKELNDDKSVELAELNTDVSCDRVDMGEEEAKKDSSKYLEIIIEQKDILISELRDKIDLLKKHIGLLDALRFENEKKSSKQSISQVSEEAPLLNVKTNNHANMEKPVTNKVKSVTSKKKDKIRDPIITQPVNICDPEVKQTSVTASNIDKIDEKLGEVDIDGATYLESNEKRRRRTNERKSTGGQIITGSRDDGEEFKGAERLAWLYVGNVNRNTTEENIRKFLEGQFNNETFLIEEIKKHETNHSKNKSFKVGFSFKILENLTQHDIWPRGVVVRRYNFFRYNRNKLIAN